MEMDRSMAEECIRKGAFVEEEVLLHSADSGVVVEQEWIGSGLMVVDNLCSMINTSGLGEGFSSSSCPATPLLL